MRKTNKAFALSLVLLLAFVFSVPAYASSAIEPADMSRVVKLTDKQKKELESQFKDILKREKKVVATYVKYGVLTKEQGKMIDSHLEKRYMKLEQNGFIPHWGRHENKHHENKEHKHHEKDHKHQEKDHKHHEHQRQ